MVSSASKLDSSTWDTVICEGVPLSLRELVELVSDNLGLHVSVQTSNQLLMCTWLLGWHIRSVTHNGISRNFWGGGVTPGTTSGYLRGDWVETRIRDVQDGVVTSRLARVICVVRIGNLRKITGLTIPVTSDDDNQVTWETDDNKNEDVMHFLIVRYARQHPRARTRGPHHRPLCPGILQNTHCLWKWAKRRHTFERGCLRGRAWERNKHFFGNSIESINNRRSGAKIRNSC